MQLHFSMQKSLRRSQAAINNSDMLFAHNLTYSDFGNATCWFWIKILDELNNDERGCSPIYTCSVGKIANMIINIIIIYI